MEPMAITAIEYTLLGDLRQSGLIPAQPTVVEFGESNWYGDVPLARLGRDLVRFVTEPGRRQKIEGELAGLTSQIGAGTAPADYLWRLAKIFFDIFLDRPSITSVDLGGTASAIKADLNRPLSLGRQFDLALDFGTAEHVFDVGQFFRTVHEATSPGGHMIHGLPFQGWIDHGFYNFQPTFLWDLAEANSYQMERLLHCQLVPPQLAPVPSREHLLRLAEKRELGENVLLYAVMRKAADESPFRVPIQGYYRGALSQEAQTAWLKLR